MARPFEDSSQAPRQQTNRDGSQGWQHSANRETESEMRWRPECEAVEMPFARESDAQKHRDDSIRRADAIRILTEMSAGRAETSAEIALLRYRQEVREVVGGMIHDFNNLFLVILYSTEHLQARCQLNGPDRSAIQAIDRARERAAGITRQLQDFLRDPSAKRDFVDLNDVVARAEPILHNAAIDNMVVRIRLTSNPALVLALPIQIDQMLASLFLNARDSMPEGGWLTIQTSHGDPAGTGSATESRRFARLRVTDTGGTTEVTPQIKNEMQARMQAVQSIVDQCGGRLTIDRSPETGSLIEIVLPGAELQTVTDSSDVFGAETILVVEDETEIRKILRTSLEARGYKVIEAEHGPAAIATALRHAGPIHLLITDVAMPEMSGPAVAEALQADFPGLPALYISGFVSDSQFAHSTVKTEEMLIRKPFKTSELLMKVRKLLDCRRST